MLRVTRADFWVGRMHARFLQPCRVLNKSRAYAHAYCLRACSRHEPKTLANIQNRRGKKHEETKSLDSRIWNLAMPAVASLLLDPILGVVDTADRQPVERNVRDEIQNPFAQGIEVAPMLHMLGVDVCHHSNSRW